MEWPDQPLNGWSPAATISSPSVAAVVDAWNRRRTELPLHVVPAVRQIAVPISTVVSCSSPWSASAQSADSTSLARLTSAPDSGSISWYSSSTPIVYASSMIAALAGSPFAGKRRTGNGKWQMPDRGASYGGDGGRIASSKPLPFDGRRIYSIPSTRRAAPRPATDHGEQPRPRGGAFSLEVGEVGDGSAHRPGVQSEARPGGRASGYRRPLDDRYRRVGRPIDDRGRGGRAGRRR
jgi:hypothetical protein